MGNSSDMFFFISQKIEFATKGLNVIRTNLGQLLALFPPREIEYAEAVYQEVYMKGPPAEIQVAQQDDEGFLSF